MHFANDPSEVGEQIIAKLRFDQRSSPLCRKNQMQQNISRCVRHILSPLPGSVVDCGFHPRPTPWAALSAVPRLYLRDNGSYLRGYDVPLADTTAPSDSAPVRFYGPVRFFLRASILCAHSILCQLRVCVPIVIFLMGASFLCANTIL